MPRHYFIVSFFVCLFVAALIRFYQLGVVPHGMTWDEAAIGYNGYALLNTRRDEWLVRLPVSFQSFGDYKAPLAIYTNGVFTKLFGMNLTAVRLPFALASIVTIAGMILLSVELFKLVKPINRLVSDEYMGLVAGFLLALSPWHIHYSRAGFESGLALCFVIWGAYLLVKGLKDISRVSFAFLFCSAISFVTSLYSYHSSKVTVPLLVVTILLLLRKEAFKKVKSLAAVGLVALLLSWPLLKDSLYGSGLERLNTSILDDTSGYALISTIANNLSRHLSPSFLVGGETTTLRHGTGEG
jgi:4-amino-4-deoxy-L-arabinose transferase-like glycosyltransferase